MLKFPPVHAQGPDYPGTIRLQFAMQIYMQILIKTHARAGKIIIEKVTVPETNRIQVCHHLLYSS